MADGDHRLTQYEVAQLLANRGQPAFDVQPVEDARRADLDDDRDYSPMARGTRVQVEMYPDRLEVLSPGGLFGPVSVDRLGEDGVASARNRALVDILENVSFPRDSRALCEGRATGIPTVIVSLRDAGLVPAEFTDRIKDFRVALPNRALLDTEARDWLDGLGQRGLSSTQRTALALLRTGRALTSDQYRIEFAVDSKVARAELTDLISRGLVRMVNQRRWARYVMDESAVLERQAASGRQPAAPGHAGIDVGTVGRETRPGIADTQELVLAALAEGPLSRREISERVGVPDRRVLYAIRKLVEAGSVAPTGPARSPHATYRLTPTDVSASRAERDRRPNSDSGG